ncbi:MAG: hypothetical protein ACK55I_24995, partial [bacterium]
MGDRTRPVGRNPRIRRINGDRVQGGVEHGRQVAPFHRTQPEQRERPIHGTEGRAPRQNRGVPVRAGRRHRAAPLGFGQSPPGRARAPIVKVLRDRYPPDAQR